MENKIIVFENSEADAIALDYFKAMCGFNRPGDRFQSMLLSGLAIRDQIKDSIQIKVIISAFDRESIKGANIEIKNLVFSCQALDQIERGSVARIYAYLLTIGQLQYNSDSVLDLFYADAWGTAYVDAGRDLLRAWLQNSHAAVNGELVSDSFGPGYYGMGMDQLAKFFQLLDAEQIGIQLNGSTMMLPLKSCAGFFLVVTDEGQLPGNDCKSCLSEAKGCNFCRYYNKKRGSM